MGKKLVIFDLDGTLADTLASIAKSANTTLAAFDLTPYETDAYRYFVGNGAANLIRECLKGRGEENESRFDEVFAEYKRVFEKYCMYQVNPYDGIMDLLNELKRRDILMAVNTNKPQNRTLDVISQLFGDGYFSCLVGQCDERARKPAPDGVYEILRQLDIDKKEALYIGDTCTDMQTGKNAGVFTVGALWGFRDRKELEENHADAIIAHPMELISLLDK